MKRSLKRLTAMGLAVILCLALAACGGGGTATEPPATQAPAGTQAPSGDAPPSNTEAPQNNEVFKLTYATSNSTESNTYKNIEKVLLDMIRERSGGRIEITEYTGGSLFKGGEAFEGARTGSCDIAFDSPANYSGSFPYTILFEQSSAGPTSAASACAVLKDFIDEYAGEIEEYEGVKMLMIGNAGPACLVGNKAVRTVEDIKGIQVRTNTTNNKAIERLGGTPVIMPMNEVYEAFSTNLIDSGWFVPEAMVGFSLQEVIKYATVWPFNNSIIFMVMNQNVYDSLPADLQAVIDEVVQEVYEDILLTYFDETFDKNLTLALELRPELEVINLTDAELDNVREVLWPLVQEYADSLDAMGLNGSEMMSWMQEKSDHYNAIYSK